jgi:hypothetical protein
MTDGSGFEFARASSFQVWREKALSVYGALGSARLEKTPPDLTMACLPSSFALAKNNASAISGHFLSVALIGRQIQVWRKDDRSIDSIRFDTYIPIQA